MCIRDRVKVIPTVSGIFDELGGDMPPSTKALISVSAFFQQHILWILLGMLLLTALSVAAVRTEEGRVKWNRLKLKVPILGKISMLNASSQFANTMSTLLGAGLPVARALAVTAKTLDNYMLSLETSKMVTGLEEGRHLEMCIRDRIYRAGVASAGNYDQRMYENSWTERYYGLYQEELYEQGDITRLAGNLKGKLFLACGALDDNVSMSQTPVSYTHLAHRRVRAVHRRPGGMGAGGDDPAALHRKAAGRGPQGAGRTAGALRRDGLYLPRRF